ncbi:MAG: hypothetical protein QF619_13665 [Candidatus Binatia bacterium]|nr:hypothetical protein [Candidatus Binatia bacterium]
MNCSLGIHSCNSLRVNDRCLQPNEAAALTHVIPQMRQFTSIMGSGGCEKKRMKAKRKKQEGRFFCLAGY